MQYSAYTVRAWGGWGNHMNGCILGAKAVYANVPQIKLLGSTYSELGMKKFFDAVLGSTPDTIQRFE